MTRKHLKRFIAISMMTAVSMTAFPCVGYYTHNYYLFHVYNSNEFSNRMDEITLDNWKSYLGSDEDLYYFDAEKIRDYANSKGDALMVSYVDNLERYLDCASKVSSDAWDYPSKEDLAQRNRIINEVRTYAEGKLTSRLRSQHALLFMRCNMLQGKHAENVTFWEQTGVKLIESVYKDMMKNIYAGALLKTNHPDEAGRLFAEMGDWSSLMTQYYKKRSYQAIRQEYQHNANSAVLPFLLQDFVNNSQEAVDEDGYGKMFVRTITKLEAQQMILLAGEVVKEGKSRVPALWMSAKAWLEYMYGNRQQALTDIDEAVKMEGTDWMKNNARVLRFYISAAQQPINAQFDNYVAGELAWLKSMNDEDGFYWRANERIVHQVLVDKYAQNNRVETSLALLNIIDPHYEYVEALDTIDVKSVESYLGYFNRTLSSPLDRYLKNLLSTHNSDLPDTHTPELELYDLIGTKYMRLCQWPEAMEWLKKVPVSFYNNAGYAAYAANRSYKVEPWIKRQWLKDSIAYSGEPQHMTSNPKMDFVKEINSMEDRLKKLKGKNHQQACYDLAVMYAQASFTGDCWYLMRNGKSWADEVRVNEADLNAKAVRLLRSAAETTDPQLKERALFALSYIYLYPGEEWFTYNWGASGGQPRRTVKPETSQYKAFAALAEFEANNKNVSSYVSRCDEYIQFCKYFKK